MTDLVEHFEFRPDDRVDDYRLLEPIGVGGEASLWSALDVPNKRVVVLKFIRKQDAPGEAASFEAYNSLAQLNHPNIRHVYATGEKGKFSYLSMRYYPHGSLYDLLNRGPMTPQEVLQLAAQLAAVLDYIHGLNIVHRDLKPTNILVDTKNRIYVTDFGLAKPLSQTTQAIHTGHGTAIYSPPEQHTKAILKHTSDIYSLGIVLFEMFTGVLPWRGQTALAIKQIDTGEQLPDPRSYNPDLPNGLGGALRALTDAEPERRPASASKAFQLVLAAFGRGLDAGWHYQDEREALAKTLQSVPPLENDAIWTKDEAIYLLDRARGEYGNFQQEFNLSLTKFSFLDSVLTQAVQNGTGLKESQIQYLVRGALAYGVHQDFWWRALSEPASRLEIFDSLIDSENQEGIHRALSMALKGDMGTGLHAMPPGMYAKLIDLALIPADGSLRQQALEFIRKTVPPVFVWQRESFSFEEDAKLASLALGEDGDLAAAAARLIGQIRSEAAAGMIWQALEEGHHLGLPALTRIREAAGSLPPSLPFSSKIRIWTKLASDQLFSNRAGLLRGYAFSAAAGALAMGFHAYATLRVSSIFNTARVLAGLGNGLLIGPLIGLGIFLTGFVVQRLRILAMPLRILSGTLLGTFVVTIGLVVHNILFLDSFPVGPWVLLGSFMMMAGFGIGNGLFSSAIARAALSTVTTSLGIGLSWVFAQNSHSSPMLRYESDQPVGTVTLLIVITSLILGIIPHLGASFKQGDDTRSRIARV